MNNAFNKSKAIAQAANDYANDPALSLRDAGKLHGVSPQSVLNYHTHQTKPAFDVYITHQRLSPIEERVLIEHALEAHTNGAALNIRNLHQFANELLDLKHNGEYQPVGVNWHSSFFKRHPTHVKFMFSRPIDKQRVKAEDPSEFIKFFRRFADARIKWGVVDSDIHNMDESGCAMGIKYKSKIIVPAEEKAAFAKMDGNRE